MQSWTFFAKILPERVPISINHEFNSESESGLGFKYNWKAFIFNSQVVCNVTCYDDDLPVETLRNAIEQDLRSIIDIAGFKKGLAFDVDVLSASRRDEDAIVVFGIGIPALLERHAQEPFQLLSDDLMAILSEPAATQALANFRRAMKVAVDTGFYCYRAIEGIMQSMKSGASEKDSIAWEKLRNDLNVDRAAIDIVKAHADNPRHGKSSQITDQERGDVFNITEEILSRFIAYLRSGSTPLDPTTYSLLNSNPISL